MVARGLDLRLTPRTLPLITQRPLSSCVFISHDNNCFKRELRGRSACGPSGPWLQLSQASKRLGGGDTQEVTTQDFSAGGLAGRQGSGR